MTAMNADIPLETGKSIVENVGELKIELDPSFMSREDMLAVLREAGFGEKELNEYLNSSDKDAYLKTLSKTL